MTTPIQVETIGGPHQHLTNEELEAFVVRNLAPLPVDGKDVVLVVPDGTRSMPLPLVMGIVHSALIGRVAKLTAVIALGTHSYMEVDEIERMFGAAPDGLEARYPGLEIVNHEWADHDQIVSVGRLSSDQIFELQPRRDASGRRGRDQPAHRRQRRRDRRRPGVPARGGRHLGRQQVLHPRLSRPTRSSTCPTGSARSSASRASSASPRSRPYGPSSTRLPS